MSKASTRGGPVAVAEAKSQPRRVTIQVEDLVPEIEEKPKRRYWLGTLKDCPYQNVHVAGTLFPRYMGNVEHDKHGDPVNKPLPGMVIQLDEDQVERVKEGVVNRVIRPIGKSKRAAMLLRSGTHRKPYRPQAGDQPLGRFLYMYDVENGFPACYHGGEPEPMVG